MNCSKCNRIMTELNDKYVCYNCPILEESQKKFLESLPPGTSVTGVWSTNNIINKPDPNIAVGVREYSEGEPVLIKKYEYDGEGKNRLVVVGINECGCNSTHVDLLDILVWVKKYRPDLLDEADTLL